MRLKITEIFHSLQGEADSVGIPTVFVRLTGCPLRCQYCDTAYAFHGGEWWELEAILARVAELGARYVCVTGGEPLAQKNCLPLLRGAVRCGLSRIARDQRRDVSRGRSIARVVRVVDVKTPGSGEADRNRYDRTAAASRPQDQVKFVICGRADYEWSRAKLSELSLERALHRAVLAEPRAAAGARAGRLDSRGSPAGALPDPASQVSCGAMCPWPLIARRRGAALGRTRFGDRAGLGARAGL